MKKILFLEDNYSTSEHTTDMLRDEGYEVEEFQRIDQAKNYFNKYKEDILCIVTDLNLSDEWLGKYKSKSEGCLLSGWVWLYYFVFKEKTPDFPTVIYSRFIDELYSKIPIEQKKILKNKNIMLVAKGTEDSEGFSGLIKAIETVTCKEKK